MIAFKIRKSPHSAPEMRVFASGVFALALVVACAGCASAEDANRVVDGDTIHLGDERIRLWGIDAPEMGTQEGSVAREYLLGLVAQVDPDMLRCQIMYHDRYGRAVARCITPDNADLACEMVRAGHARDWPGYSGGYYARCEGD